LKSQQKRGGRGVKGRRCWVTTCGNKWRGFEFLTITEEEEKVSNSVLFFLLHSENSRLYNAGNYVTILKVYFIIS